MSVIKQLRAGFAEMPGVPCVEPDPTADAAVLIAITDSEDPAVVLIVKSGHLRTHAGEVALPGGRRDAGDVSIKAAALREAWEETGLKPESVELLGTMAPAESKFGLQVVPFVGLIPAGTRLMPDRSEVQSLFYWPLSELLADRQIGVDELERPGSVLRVPAYEWEGQRIWGLTAQFLVLLANRCLGTSIEITSVPGRADS